MAFKLGNQWNNHDYNEIIASTYVNAGAEVGCNNCNYKSAYFDDANNCIIIAYYEIRPMFKGGVTPPKAALTGIPDEEIDLSHVDTKGVKLRNQIDKENEALIKAYDKFQDANELRTAKTNKLLDSHNHFKTNQDIIEAAFENYQEKVAVIAQDNTQFIESIKFISNSYDMFLGEVERITSKKYNKYDSKRKIRNAANNYFELANKIPFQNKTEVASSSKSIEQIKREMSGEAFRIEPVPSREEISYHVLFKVIANPDMKYESLKNIGPLYRETYTDIGTTRYLMGSSDSPRDVEQYLKLLRQNGFTANYIVEYKNGQLYRYYEKEVEKKVETIAAKPTSPAIQDTPTAVSKPQVNYRIDQIFDDEEVSYHILFRVLGKATEDFPELRHIGPLYRETFDDNGTTRYLIGNSLDIEGARKLINLVKDAGYKSSYIAEYQHGKLSRYID